ncbi:MAG TPA: hypothetical protein VG900_15555 [Hyphomicrobiaceae bacterium]|nr:hypothetical protein [Hyphomicrobiaceae bacterium]
MNADIQSARDDLAYLRGLVSESGQFQAVAGELFAWAGFIYGVQCIGHFLNAVGVLPLPPQGQLALAFGPTILFLAVLGAVLWRVRKTPQTTGVATRALNAAFQGAGLANLVMAFVFAYGANTAHNFTIWLYHPIVVCMFQGVAWFVAWTIRRRAWVGLVALGWIVTTITLGVLVGNIAGYLLTLGLGLILFMGVPGYAMMRSGKAS